MNPNKIIGGEAIITFKNKYNFNSPNITKIMNPKNNKYAIKTFKLNNTYHDEKNAMLKLINTDINYKLIAYNDKYKQLIYPKFNNKLLFNNPFTIIKNIIFQLINAYNVNIYASDLDINNIVFDNNNNPILIDYDNKSTQKDTLYALTKTILQIIYIYIHNITDIVFFNDTMRYNILHTTNLIYMNNNKSLYKLYLNNLYTITNQHDYTALINIELLIDVLYIAQSNNYLNILKYIYNIL